MTEKDKRPLPPRETSPAAKREEKRMFSQTKLNTDDAKDVSFLHLCNCVWWSMFTCGDAFRDFNFKHLHSWFLFGYYGLWWIFAEYSWCWAGKIGALSIQPNRSKMWKQRQVAQKFPWKVSINSGNRFISEMRTIQPKILEIPGDKLNGKKTSGKKISAIWYTSLGCPHFGNFWKCCFIRYWKLSKIQTGSFGWMESWWFLHSVTLVWPVLLGGGVHPW